MADTLEPRTPSHTELRLVPWEKLTSWPDVDYHMHAGYGLCGSD